MRAYAILPGNVVEAWPSLSAPAKAVAVALASFMNRDGVCWPTMHHLAARAGYGQRRSAEIALAELEKRDLVTVQRRHGHSPNRFRWREAFESDSAGDDRDEPVAPERPERLRKETRTFAQRDPNVCAKRPERLRAPLIVNNTNNNTNNNTRNKDTESKEAAAHILKAYAEVKPPSLDGSRGRARKHILKLLGRHPAGDLLRAVENYRLQTLDTEPKYRRGAGNFFGRDEDWKVYADPDWEPPEDPDEPAALPEELLEKIEAAVGEENEFGWNRRIP